jgi:hypothetical protein
MARKNRDLLDKVTSWVSNAMRADNGRASVEHVTVTTTDRHRKAAGEAL